MSSPKKVVGLDESRKFYWNVSRDFGDLDLSSAELSQEEFLCEFIYFFCQGSCRQSYFSECRIIFAFFVCDVVCRVSTRQ